MKFLKDRAVSPTLSSGKISRKTYRFFLIIGIFLGTHCIEFGLQSFANTPSGANNFLLNYGGAGILGIQSAYAAEGKCALESGVSPELSKYSTDLTTALGKIEQAAASESCGDGGSGDVELAASEIEGSINSVLGQNTYRASSAFVTDLQIKSETPKPITTHLSTLYEQGRMIQDSMRNLYAKCGNNKKVPASEIFPGGSNNEATAQTLGEYSKAILQNHTELIHLYRTTVLGYPQETDFFSLVSNKDFSSDLKKNYGTKAQETCKKKGDIFKQLSEAINKLGVTAQSIKKGMFAWQTADLKTESAGEREMREDREKNLVPSMRRVGLNENASENATRKSKKYNLLDGDRGLSGFVRDSGERLVQTFDSMKNSFSFVPKVQEAKTTDEWLLRYKNLATLKDDIAKEINGQFLYQIDLLGNEQTNKDDYEGRLGRIYIEVEAVRKKLEEYRKVARKICKIDQAANVDAAGCEGE